MAKVPAMDSRSFHAFTVVSLIFIFRAPLISFMCRTAICSLKLGQLEEITQFYAEQL
jgi:hypothetical protein